MDDGVFARNFMELHESSGKHNDSVSEGDQIFNLDEAEQESSPEETLEIEDGISAESVPHRWAGWPGDNVFRMLVPTQRVGSIIGRKGELIKKIVEETRSRIKILDGPPGEAERIVMVSAKEEPHVHLPPAIEGLLRVHRRVTDGLDRDDDDADDSSDVVPAGLTVTTRVLVAATQAGNLIGRQGATVKSIQDASNSTVKVLGIEELPMFALQDDRVIEIVGDPVAVHKALELVACQLRKFLVDRSVIPLFEKLVHVGSNWKDSAASPPHHSWGPPAQPNADYAHTQPQYMNPNDGGGYYASDMPHQHHAHHGSTPSSPPIITQHMQILLSYADAVIGASGANISYIRRGSGATVTIQETRGIPGEMTVEINGTAAQVQIAQQLIQNFMMEASAPAAQLTQGGGSAEQNYNGYGGPGQAQGSVYSATPAAQGGQAAGLGSVYGPGYGY